jgi:hypothetical protein
MSNQSLAQLVDKARIGAAEVRIVVSGAALLPTADAGACCCCCSCCCSARPK